MEMWCRKTKGTCGNDKYFNRKSPVFLCVIFWEILIFLHRVSIPFASNGIFIEKEAGYYKIFSDELGFVVKIDISGNIQILLQEKHYNKTCGLCGNFNRFAEDDFRTQEGKTTTNCILVYTLHTFPDGWFNKHFADPAKGFYQTCQVSHLDVLKSYLTQFFHLPFSWKGVALTFHFWAKPRSLNSTLLKTLNLELFYKDKATG